MRYKLENGQPVLITRIDLDGQTITNPPDDLIDANGLGYPKTVTPAPIYDPSEETLSSSWEIQSGVITQVWTVTELSAAEKAAKHNAAIDAAIDAINEAYAEWQTEPLEYTFNESTMYLKPIWITQYYGTLLQASTLGATVFPSGVTDAHDVTYEMTEAQFAAMYLWLVGQAAVKIATVNAQIATLKAQKEVVNE